MAKRLKCPNCGGNVANHAENGCVLAALVQLVREREAMSERRLRKLHAGTDVDALWQELGPVIDGLEDGAYST